jgi:hypothetical protein
MPILDYSNEIKAEIMTFMVEKFQPDRNDVADKIFDKVELADNMIQHKIVDDIGIDDFELTGEMEAYKIASNVQGLAKIGKVNKFTKKIIASEETVEGLPQIKNFFMHKAQKMMEAYKRTREKVLATAYNKGGITTGHAYFNGGNFSYNDTSGDVVYDGKPFFNLTNNTRTDSQGNTYYNHIGALALTTANLATACNMMEATNAKNYLGEAVDITATRLLIPKNLKQTAHEITKTMQYMPTGTTDTSIPANYFFQHLEPIAWSQLTDVDGWFVLGDKNPAKELVKKSNIPYGKEIVLPEINISYDDEKGCYVMTAKLWCGFLVDQWQYAIASNIATS